MRSAELPINGALDVDSCSPLDCSTIGGVKPGGCPAASDAEAQIQCPGDHLVTAQNSCCFVICRLTEQ
jgi:hypothetical protein